MGEGTGLVRENFSQVLVNELEGGVGSGEMAFQEGAIVFLQWKQQGD